MAIFRLWWCIPILAGCTVADGTTETSAETRGDTTIVTVADNRSTRSVGNTRVLWKDPALVEPRGMVGLSNGALVIGDRFHVHWLEPDGSLIRTVGGRGEGPGEFGDISAIGVKNDTVILVDARQRRLSLYDSAGSFLESHHLPLIRDLPNLGRVPGHIGTWSRGILLVARSLVEVDAPSRRGVIQIALSDGWNAVPLIVRDFIWTEADHGGLTIKTPYGPRALVALGNDGMIFWSDGINPCVHVERVDSSEVERFCIRRGPLSLHVDALHGSDFPNLPEDRRETLQTLVKAQEFPNFLPFYDEIVFAGNNENNKVWLRTMDERFRDKHVWSNWEDLRERTWDMYDADAGFSGSIALPAHFVPMLSQQSRVVGFLTLETGEVTIAEVPYE